MMMQLLASVLGSVFWLSSASFASVLVQDNFLRTGQTESLIAPLTQFGGVTTAQKWSGLVEVILSGEAINNPPTGLHVDPPFGRFHRAILTPPRGPAFDSEFLSLGALHRSSAARQT